MVLPSNNAYYSTEFVDTKLMTRATYSLSGIEGPLFFDKDGQLTFLEKDGIDYAPATVQVWWPLILRILRGRALYVRPSHFGRYPADAVPFLYAPFDGSFRVASASPSCSL